jgi:hypothetical protein
MVNLQIVRNTAKDELINKTVRGTPIEIAIPGIIQ